MASPKEKLIAEALKLVEKGQHERAVKTYLKVVEIDDKDVRVWLKIGDLYTKLRRNHEAAETYERVAQFYSDQGFYTKAIAVYKQILKLDPSMVAVYARLADLYRQMGLLPDAIEQYQSVAAHHQARGDMRAALGPIKQITELDPSNVASRVKLAEMYSKEHMVREAIDEFARAAEFLHEQGRFDDYMKVAERLLFHSPDNRPVSRELARLYLRKGDARRALPRLQVCFKADPRDTDTLGLLADAFEALGQKVKAVSVLKELARVLAENGHSDPRDATYRRILQLDPGDLETQRLVSESRRPAEPLARADRTPPQIPAAAIAGRVTVEQPAPAFLSSPGLPLPPPSSPSLPAIPTQLAGPASPSPRPRLASNIFAGATAQPGSPMSSTGMEPVTITPAEETEIAKILAETDVFMKYALHAKAVEHVKTVFEKAPTHLGAREKLRSIHLALGHTDEAIEELRILARQTAGTPAEGGYLDELLQIAPGDAWAREQLAAAARLGALGAPATRSSSVAPLAPAFNPRFSPTGTAEVLGDDDLSMELDVEVDGIEELAPQDVEIDDVSVDSDFVEEAESAAAARPDTTAEATAEIVEDPLEEEFRVVVDSAALEPPAPAANGVEIEDRFGADLDEPFMSEPASIDLRPEESFAGLSDDLVGEQTTFAPSPSLLTGGGDVDNFDFSSFDDPTAGASTGSPSQNSAAAAPRLVGRPAVALAPELVEAPQPDFGAGPEADFAALDALDAFGPLGGEAEATGEIVEGASDGTALSAILEEPGAEPGLEDELDEADFFLAQGLYDDAREALSLLLDRYPQHPLLLSKLQELDAAAAGGASDATVAIDPATLARPPQESTQSTPAAPARGSSKRPGVDAVGINEDDFESHFDLGIAYKEMGLVDQAIAEFQFVMRDPTRQVVSHQMLGLCFMGKGQVHEAISHFKQGLYADGIADDEELSLYYDLGCAYQQVGDNTEALYYFERIRKRKPRYRDVPQLLRQMAPGGSAGDDFEAPANAASRK